MSFQAFPFHLRPLCASFSIPTGPEEVVRTLCLVAPDAGRPPPEVVGAALKAAGIAATEENLERALREANEGRAVSSEDLRLARQAAVQYSSEGAEMGARGRRRCRVGAMPWLFMMKSRWVLATKGLSQGLRTSLK